MNGRGTRTLAAVMVASCVLGSGCSAHGAPPEGRATGRLRLLPPPCRHADILLAPGQRVSPATGEHALAFEVRARHGSVCSLWGSPEVRLRDSVGAVLKFDYVADGQYVGHAPAVPVVVRSGHPGFFLVAKYRCDVLRQPRDARSMGVRLPSVSGRFQVRFTGWRASVLTLCGAGGQASRQVEVSAVRSSFDQPAGKAPPDPAPYAVSLRSPYSSPFGASYGRGDLNGDGHPDLVVVRTNGLVTARITGLGVRRLRLPRNPGLRLQALSTLARGSRDYVLVAASAKGYGGGYVIPNAGTTVLALEHGRLRLVRIGRHPWGIGFYDGGGDLYSGLVCTPTAITEVLANPGPPNRVDVLRRRYRFEDGQLRLVAEHTTHLHGWAKASRLSRTRCPGMGPRGWASPGPGP